MVKRNHIDSIRFWELLFLNQLKNAVQIRELAGRETDRLGEPDEEPLKTPPKARGGCLPRQPEDMRCK